MEELILFLLTFLFVFLLYEIFIVSPRKKANSKKKEIIEIKYLDSKYPLDFKKIPYAQLLQICAITSSIDIAIVVTVLARLDNYWLIILVGLFLILVLIIFSYHLVYLFYKKKGMIIDGKRK